MEGKTYLSERDAHMDPSIMGEEAPTHGETECEEDNKSIRHYLWDLCEHPSSSVFAQIFELISTGLTATSIVVFILSTIPGENREDTESLMKIMYFCVGYSVFEFCIRFATAPNRCIFIVHPINLVDFTLAVTFLASFWERLTLLNNFVKFFQVVRIVKVLKVSTKGLSSEMRMLVYTVKESLMHIFMLLVYIMTGALVMATLLYWAELSVEKGEREINSIPIGMYWAIITMTTVGYGDIVAMSYAGKYISTVCALSSLLAVAMIVAIISHSFREVYRTCKLEKLKKKYEHSVSKINFEINENKEDDFSDRQRENAKRHKFQKENGDYFDEVAPTSILAPSTPKKSPAQSLHYQIAKLESILESARVQRMKTELQVSQLVVQCYEYKQQVELLLMDETGEFRVEFHNFVLDANLTVEPFDPHLVEISLLKVNDSNPVHEFLQYPSTRLAWAYTLMITGINIIAILMHYIESIPRQLELLSSGNEDTVSFWIGNTLYLIIGLDFLVQMLYSPNKKEFLSKLLNLLDIVVLVSYFIATIFKFLNIQGDVLIQETIVKPLQIFRINRIARILLTSRFSCALKSLAETMHRSKVEFGVLFLYLLIGSTIFSTFAYFAEFGVPDSKFTNILASVVWSFSTLMTEGSGILLPQTTSGLFLTVLCSLFAVMVLALPTALISSSFTNVYHQLHEREGRLAKYCTYFSSIKQDRLHVKDFVSSDIELLKMIIDSDIFKKCSAEVDSKDIPGNINIEQ